tara:strand:+ start:46 stop:222 length:177 start_codon:yes stop_codon:yes gene_type:complete
MIDHGEEYYLNRCYKWIDDNPWLLEQTWRFDINNLKQYDVVDLIDIVEGIWCRLEATA